MSQLSATTREQATTSDEIVVATMEMNELVQQVTQFMNEQSQSVDGALQSFEEMQKLVGEVAQAMREQSNRAEQVAESALEINAGTQQSLTDIKEMDSSTASMAAQTEELKQLASSFENEDDSAEGNGRLRKAEGQIYASKRPPFTESAN
jgi:methyl-accepting chemotaxis protein